MNGVILILLQELCLIFNLFICFGIPFLGFFLLIQKQKNITKSFFIGMATFFTSQMLIRLPLLQYVLPKFMWFELLRYHPIPNILFYGFTAGIFEETARLIFMKLFLKRNHTFRDGLAFGLGHGGIEAILLVGCNSAVLLFYSITNQSNLIPSSNFSLFLGGIERIFAIMFHVGASLLILHGIRSNQALKYTLIAILLHGICDSSFALLARFFSTSEAMTEVLLGIFSSIILLFSIHLFFPFKQKQFHQKEI